VGRDVDGDGSSNSKKQIQKQLKKPDLYEEEKIEGKSKQKWQDLTVDGSSESSAVVVVVIRLGSSAAGWTGLARRGGTVDGSLESSELNGGWRPEMEEPVAMVAGGRRCSAGGWLLVGWMEGGDGANFFWGEIEMTLGWDDLKILREGEEWERERERGNQEKVCVWEKEGFTRIVTRCHHSSRSFKWTVQIKEIVAGQFLWYCRGSQS
jgi:hypothetical protein